MGPSVLLRAYVKEVLQKYPELRLQPCAGDETVLAGRFEFVAQTRGHAPISDCYEVTISVASDYPRTVPLVRETAERIPRNFHRLDSGHLCLGSPTRLRLILAETPSLLSFVERCLVPYLYGYSIVEGGGDLPFGELSHGLPGLRDDLALMLCVENDRILLGFVRLLALKKRKANKLLCPCGSGNRLGRCHNRIINRLREKLGRGWFSSLIYGSRRELVERLLH
jgi:hypothetical protein